MNDKALVSSDVAVAMNVVQTVLHVNGCYSIDDL
jgi:hypothetical protein